MLNDKRLKLVIDRSQKSSGGGYRIYEFTPSLTRMFYKDYEKQTPQRWIRFFFELLKGYRAYYLEVGNEIVAYSVISRGGGRYSFATKEDIVVGPYFVLEQHRGHHYSEILVSELLHYEGIKYRYAYDWIRQSNTPSLKCSDRVGLKITGTADVVRPFRKIILREDNSGEFFILMGKREELRQMEL